MEKPKRLAASDRGAGTALIRVGATDVAWPSDEAKAAGVVACQKCGAPNVPNTLAGERFIICGCDGIRRAVLVA